MANNPTKELVYIDRTDQFDKAKRNFVWFSAALCLSAFAAERHDNAQPLLGVAISPHWLAFALLFATIYTGIHFWILWNRERAINSRMPNSSVEELENLATRIAENWSHVGKNIEIARERTQSWLDSNSQLPSPDNDALKENLRDLVNRSVLQEASIEGSYAWDDWREDTLMQLTELYKLANSHGHEPDGPEYYFENHARALIANVPEVPGNTMFERMKRVVDRATDEKLDQDYSTILLKAVGSNEEFRSNMTRVASEISSLAKSARTLRRLKVGLTTGERVLHFGINLGVPIAIALIGVGLSLTAYSDDWAAAIADPYCKVPFLRSDDCPSPPIMDAGNSREKSI